MNSADFLTEKIKLIPPSGIRKFFDVAATMDDVISLGIGEPDFSTPMSFCEAGIKTLKEGITAYTGNYGLIELRQEIAKYLANLIQVEYNPATEILTTVGGSEAVDITFRAICEPGDEVIIPEPAFVAYRPCVTLAGGVPVPVATTIEQGFKITPQLIENSITPKTKALLLNFPCNPTGVTMNREELGEIAKVCIRHNLLVISDEIYAELIYGEEFVSIASLPGMRERTVIISGVSKAFAMTGWRIGYLAAPEPLLSGIAKVHQFAIMCAPTTGQHVALEAFRIGKPEVAKMVSEYAKRREFIFGRLKEIGLDVYEPKGAFYIFPSIKKSGLSSEEFCNRLLLEYKIATVPGSAFGESGEGYIRCSYATSMEKIAKACDGIEAFFANL